MEIGRKIYYELSTGNVILDKGEHSGKVSETTIEQDISSFNVLSERDRESFDAIQLEYGQYIQEFLDFDDYRVNLDTRELEFYNAP